MRTPRLCLGLLLLGCIVSLVPAQPPGEMGDRHSHILIPNEDLLKDRRPEDLLADRLNGVRSLKQMQDELLNQKGIQDLARRLLKDKEFVESMRKQFSQKDLEKMLGKVGKGDGIGSDPALQKLLREAREKAELTPTDKDLMNKWSEQLREKGVVERPNETGVDKGGANANVVPPTPPPVPQPQPPVTRPPASADERLPDWLKDYTKQWVKDFDKWADSANGKSWQDAVKDIAGRVEKNRASLPNLGDRARGLTKYLPKYSDILPKARPPRLPEVRLPGLPRLGGVPSMPRLSGGGSGNGGWQVLLTLLACGVVAFLLWRVGGKWLEQVHDRRLARWRLGPWPVDPQAVSTRGELVRAFEYLALLCLGPAARSRHHLELADRIGGQPTLDPDRRRDAASSLAQLYEQARYTPDDERLDDADLHRARRELCYLAGVGG